MGTLAGGQFARMIGGPRELWPSHLPARAFRDATVRGRSRYGLPLPDGRGSNNKTVQAAARDCWSICCIVCQQLGGIAIANLSAPTAPAKTES